MNNRPLFHPTWKATAISCLAILGLTTFATAQSDTASMKAIVVHEYGGPEVLKLEDAPRPEPKGDEVLIRVMAAGVNPVDAYVRTGRFGAGRLPFIPGMDVAGVVAKTGADVNNFKTGDSVYAYLSFREQGGYAEYVIAKQSEMARKPQRLSYGEAAAVPLAGTTAWQALVAKAHISSG